MSEHAPVFPFCAVAGQDEAKLALLIAIIEPKTGGVLLRGERGSSKSTLVRGMAELVGALGERGRSMNGLAGGRFVELPLGVTEDRLAGGFDVDAALTEGSYRFKPGLLAEADGGVLYVDEINLLPDHIVDMLLDVAASGVNRVERDGFSHTHPARFVLVGSMNAEEGELRPQLLDRFGLSVEVAAPAEAAERVLAVRRRLDFDEDPEGFSGKFASGTRDLVSLLSDARSRIAQEGIGEDLLFSAAEICLDAGVDGLRGDIVLCRSARALWALEGVAPAPEPEHVERISGMVLAHRRRRSPLDGNSTNGRSKERGHAPRENESSNGETQARRSASTAGSDRQGAKMADNLDDSPVREHEDSPLRGDVNPNPGGGEFREEDLGGERSPTGAQSKDQSLRPLEGNNSGSRIAVRTSAPLGNRTKAVQGMPPTGSGVVRRGQDGRRDQSIIASREKGGHVIRTVRNPAGRPELSPSSTVSAMAIRQLHDQKAVVPNGMRVETKIQRSDLRYTERAGKVARQTVVALDLSGSMEAKRRVSAALKLVDGILLDSYSKRHKVSVVAFQGDDARVVVSATRSVEVIHAHLNEAASGGATPLSKGIALALQQALESSAKGEEASIVLITDGRATSSATIEDGADPVEEALAIAGQISECGFGLAVVDTESAKIKLGIAKSLAERAGGAYYRLEEFVGTE